MKIKFIRVKDDKYVARAEVPSERNPLIHYCVLKDIYGNLTCNCMAYAMNRRTCKHIEAVLGRRELVIA